jgi:hypothetical protein
MKTWIGGTFANITVIAGIVVDIFAYLVNCHMTLDVTFLKKKWNPVHLLNT